MKYTYDLHIHSALSPCSEADMTPNNIVNMSLIAGLDIIAVADHNNTGNLRAVMKVASATGLVVVPGFEMETQEEIHLLCYFADIGQAEQMAERIMASLPPIENREDIFGEQLYFDSEDNIIGREKQLLVTASSISFDKAVHLCRSLGGAPVPAHIDKSAYSVISQLGWIPEELELPCVELSARTFGAPLSEALQRAVGSRNIISSSDAHDLPQIGEPLHHIELREKSALAVVEYLRSPKQ